MSVADPKIASIDPELKRIHLIAPDTAGEVSYHPVDDIYKEMRHLRATVEANQWFQNPVSAGGAVPKGGGKYTPRYAILNNGWRIVPYEYESHTVYITGEQLTDEGGAGPACMDTSTADPAINIFMQYEPPAAEIIVIESGGGGDAPTAQEIRAEMDANSTKLAAIYQDTSIDLPAAILEASLTTGEIVAAVLAGTVEGSYTLQQVMRLLLAVATNKSSGGGTASIHFRDVADSKDRLVVTVDENGNRTAVGTRDGT
jgi:hypothetical protein